MKIVTVAPISRGMSKESLTYYTSKEVSLGALVRVPLRSKTVSALVLDVHEASDIKSEIRSSDFAIKKIESIAAHNFLTTAFMESVAEAGTYFASTTGAVLNSLLPKTVLENAYRIKKRRPPEQSKRNKQEDDRTYPRATSHEKFLIQSVTEERFSNYKSIIREQFARGSSVLFTVPAVENIQTVQCALEKGIEQYTYILHGSLKKEEVISRWNALASEPHPVLIITTPSFFAVPRSDIGTVVVEEENDRAYKNQTRPFVDMRTFAEIFAKKIDANLIMGDLLLRAETIWRYKQADFLPYAPLKFRMLSQANSRLIDMTGNSAEKDVGFKVLSDELKEIINSTREQSERLIIYAGRKGLSPTTVCGDCGTTVLCSVCSTPTVLHTTGKGNFFLCHKCGDRRDADEKCVNCESWRLTPLGIGVERVEEEIKNQFPSAVVFRLDSLTASTRKKTKDITRSFMETPGGILIGTEMMLRYINEPVENVAVATIDALFAVPDFRIQERILSILFTLRSFASKEFLIQSRQPEAEVFDHAINGNLNDYYQSELKDRKQFSYPPYSTLIKISLEGTRESVEAEMVKVKEDLSSREIFVFPAFVPRAKGKHSMHAIIKIPRDEWVDKKLLKYLTDLSPKFEINVNPESLL